MTSLLRLKITVQIWHWDIWTVELSFLHLVFKYKEEWFIISVLCWRFFQISYPGLDFHGMMVDVYYYYEKGAI